MDKHYSYAWEKLYVAVRGAVMSQDTLQHRVYGAWLSGLHGIVELQVPPSVWKRLKSWRDEVTSEEAVGSEGNALATVRKMTDVKAEQLLEELVSMYDFVARKYGN